MFLYFLADLQFNHLYANLTLENLVFYIFVKFNSFSKNPKLHSSKISPKFEIKINSTFQFPVNTNLTPNASFGLS